MLPPLPVPTRSEPPSNAQVILAGGGLANALIALWLISQRPDATFLLAESGEQLGGNHTWSFHGSDLSPAAFEMLRPFAVASWNRQTVRFPGHQRTIEAAYHAITSERLHSVLAPRLGTRLMLKAHVTEIGPHQVTLADGRVLRAPCVIDGRGPSEMPGLSLGFQKFAGLEIETAKPHDETAATIMDAQVEQHDGYRFIYTLPFTATRILIEDTYYSDGSALHPDTLRARVLEYAARKGWSIQRIVREESGVLPIVLAGDMDAFWQAAGAVPRSGLRAGLFHPTTGYSLPDAVAFAQSLTALGDLNAASVRAHVERFARARWEARGFYRLINRMMFLAAEPSHRVRLLERFYTLPEDVIARFYAGALTALDKARIIAVMAVNPPLPLGKAFSVFPSSSARGRGAAP